MHPDTQAGFIRMVTITVAPDRETAFFAFWQWASALAQQRPGYIRGRLLRAREKPGRFTEMHEWRCEADSDAYRASEPFREVVGRLRALALTPPQVMGFLVEGGA